MSNTDKFLKERYDPINNRTIHYENDERLKRVLGLISKCDTATTCLDIGCYDGEIALQIVKKMGEKCEMYGIDVADNVKDEVESRGIHYKHNDLNRNIDFKDNFFDFVFAGEIIEHIYDTDLFISEIKRVLKPNGVLIMTTPNFVSFGRRLMYIIGKGAFMEASLTFPKKAAGHIRFFTKDLLWKYLEANGFEIDTYISDEVNLPHCKINFLAHLFPTIGHHLIFKAINKK